MNGDIMNGNIINGNIMNGNIMKAPKDRAHFWTKYIFENININGCFKNQKPYGLYFKELRKPEQ